MEGLCHSWPHYFTEIQGLDRVSWVAKGQVQWGQCISHLHYWWLLFAALPRCLPKSSSFTVRTLSPLNLLLMLPTSLSRVSINSTSSLKIPMHQSHAIQTVLGEAKPRGWPDVPSWPETVLVYTSADVIVPLFLSKLTWLEWQVIKILHYKLCFLMRVLVNDCSKRCPEQ